MRCKNCGREVGSVKKCIYCGGPVETETESRFDTTIINGNVEVQRPPQPPAAHTPSMPQDSQPSPSKPPMGRPASPGLTPSPKPAPPAQMPPQGASVPRIPQQQPISPQGIQPVQKITPPQKPFSAPPAGAQIPKGPGIPQQAPGQTPRQAAPRPPQPFPAAPPMPGQRPVSSPPPAGIQTGQPQPGIPIQIQPPLKQPVRPAGQVPPAAVHPQYTPPPKPPVPSQAQIPPRPVSQGIPQQQPRPAAPFQQPIKPPLSSPPSQAPGYAVPPIPLKPIDKPQAPFAQSPRPATAGAPQTVTQPIAPSSPFVAAPVQHPPLPYPQAGGMTGIPAAQQPPTPAQGAGIPPQQPHLPGAQPAPQAHTYESGINLRPIDQEMEVMSSAEFISQDNLQFDFPSFGQQSSDELPPAFARAREEASAPYDGIKPVSTEPFAKTDKADLLSGEELLFDQEQRRKGLYISDQEKHKGNETIYKIITIAMTLISFFTLRIIDALRIGTSNPYDKIFFLRLLIFALLFTFTGYLFFIKTLGKKENTVKAAVIVLLVLASLGSFAGMSGISTSPDSNFYTADPKNYYRLMDNPKGMAQYPVFSPDGKTAACTYAINSQMEKVITLLKINIENEDKPADLLETTMSCDNQMFWYSPTEILFPGKKVSPSEPFRFELLDIPSSTTTTLFSSYDYNFVMDYDYNRAKKTIAASYANLIWLYNFDTTEMMPITGLDLLVHEYAEAPNPNEFTLNPSGFITALKDNRASLSTPAFIDVSPRFTQDGKTVYFVRSDPANMNASNICRVNLDRLFGKSKPAKLDTTADLYDFLMESTEILTSDQTAYGRIAVSPGGRFTACWVRTRKGDSLNINLEEKALVLFDTKEKALIKIFPTYPTEANINQVNWSPDGKYLIADMNSGINSIIILIEVPSVIAKMDKEFANR